MDSHGLPTSSSLSCLAKVIGRPDVQTGNHSSPPPMSCTTEIKVAVNRRSSRLCLAGTNGESWPAKRGWIWKQIEKTLCTQLFAHTHTQQHLNKSQAAAAALPPTVPSQRFEYQLSPTGEAYEVETGYKITAALLRLETLHMSCRKMDFIVSVKKDLKKNVSAPLP